MCRCRDWPWIRTTTSAALLAAACMSSSGESDAGCKLLMSKYVVRPRGSRAPFQIEMTVAIRKGFDARVLAGVADNTQRFRAPLTSRLIGLSGKSSLPGDGTRVEDCHTKQAVLVERFTGTQRMTKARQRA